MADNAIRPSPNPLNRWPRLSFADSVVVDVALGNGSQVKVMLIREGLKSLAVGVMGFGAYEFSSYAHWSYVKAKLNFSHNENAANFADFINYQLNAVEREQGTYSPAFTTRGGAQ